MRHCFDALRFFQLAGFGLSVLVRAACSSAPRGSTQSDPEQNLTRYKTFGFFSPLGADHPKYGTILSRQLKNSTRTALEAKGVAYTADHPDVLINFTASVQQKTEVTSMPDAGMTYPWRSPWYSPWGGYNDVDVHQYDDGTLVVDLIDATQKQMIWQGTAKSVVERDPQKNAEQLKLGIDAMFAQFPAR